MYGELADQFCILCNTISELLPSATAFSYISAFSIKANWNCHATDYDGKRREIRTIHE